MFIVQCFRHLSRAPEERNVGLIRQLTTCFAPNGARINKGCWCYKHLAPLERRHSLKVALET